MRLRLAIAAIACAVAGGGIVSTAAAQQQQTSVPKEFRGVVAQGALWSSSGGGCPSPQHLIDVFDMQLIITGCKFDDFELMAQAGVEHMRVFLPWMAIQPNPNVSPEQGLREEVDDVVRHAALAGVRLMPFISHTPAWVQGNDRADPLRPPLRNAQERRHFRAISHALATRYGTRGRFWNENPDVPRTPVRQWQIWNEVNSPNHFRPRPNARAYLRLLRIGADAIRNADPAAEIMLAGMFFSPGGGNLPTATTSLQMLERIYRFRASRRFFDSVALHPYAPNLRGMRDQIVLIRQLMDRSGDRRTPIRITELGWSSDEREYPEAGRQAKGPRGQAQMLNRAWRVLIRNRQRLRIKSVAWFSWQDAPRGAEVGACSFCFGSGLVEYADRSTKPVFNAFRNLGR